MHNSGWVQSPGKYALMDPVTAPHLEAYVKGVVSAFGADHRVLAWDVWNEPDNMNSNSCEPPAPSLALALAFVLFGLSRRASLPLRACCRLQTTRRSP